VIKNSNITLKKLDKVYSKQNPSFFIKNLNKKKIEKLINNRTDFLLKLKLTKKNFQNADLLDLGCGSGQNTIVFDYLGASCTMIEFNKNSFNNARKLFKNYSKKKFKIINKDLFKFKTSRKFDIVVSNGVAHHTYNVKKNIELACKYVKKDGFLILGVCTPEGWFQRNLQRAILFNVSNSTEEIIKNAKKLFSEHLSKSKKYGLRTIDEIIFDTYVNPKIDCISFKEIKRILNKNQMLNFSSLNYEKNIYNFVNPNYEQQKQSISKDIDSKDFNLSPIHEFSIANYKFKKKSFLKSYKLISKSLNKVVEQMNNIDTKTKINFSTRNLLKLADKVNYGLKVNLMDVNYVLNFINEIKKIYNILSSKESKDKKFMKIKKVLRMNKNLFKGTCGVGMNYFVGHKR
tara:strand:- start:7857 stop:9062 length:1206 start_codon:yes stop_codon:yes gene_type:complete